MNFNLKRPCAHCPFRSDIRGYLHPKRAQEIADQMADDHYWFACHETTTAKHRSVRHDKAEHCAGLMILLRKIGCPNIPMRLASVFKGFDPSALDMKAPVVNTFKQFVKRHTEEQCRSEKGSTMMNVRSCGNARTR